MLNEVMDSVNTDHIQVKLNELKEKRDELQNDGDNIDKQIEEWRQTFVAENGREPTDEDR